MAETYIPRSRTLSLRQTYRYTGRDAHRLAVARTRDYLDDERWNIIVDALRRGVSFKEARFCFMLVGVEGFPVKAMLREFHIRYTRRFGPPSARTTED